MHHEFFNQFYIHVELEDSLRVYHSVIIPLSHLNGDFVQVQLIRIELRVPEYGWTTQKVFHLLNFIVNGGEFLQTFSLE